MRVRMEMTLRIPDQPGPYSWSGRQFPRLNGLGVRRTYGVEIAHGRSAHSARSVDSHPSATEFLPKFYRRTHQPSIGPAQFLQDGETVSVRNRNHRARRLLRPPRLME